MPEEEPQQPEGKFHGLPYDFRKPTGERIKSRLWNAADPRMFPPKSFGAGWTLNFYWLVHPLKYAHRKDTE
ncbi:MAG TPA: DUF5808 domain-containing protein [Actinomycetota bacterium]|nr:DUF5808 domain-containing protein [Actinomycetota bacterium]